jgi:uncharacterized protein YqfB (UPF0267 family)
MKKYHYLKTWPVFYADVECGAKTFEIRKNDRNFQVGDILCLREYEPKTKKYSGEFLLVSVDYTIHLNGLPDIPDGFIGMSISLLSESESDVCTCQKISQTPGGNFVLQIDGDCPEHGWP